LRTPSYASITINRTALRLRLNNAAGGAVRAEAEDHGKAYICLPLLLRPIICGRSGGRLL